MKPRINEVRGDTPTHEIAVEDNFDLIRAWQEHQLRNFEQCIQANDTLSYRYMPSPQASSRVIYQGEVQRYFFADNNTNKYEQLVKFLVLEMTFRTNDDAFTIQDVAVADHDSQTGILVTVVIGKRHTLLTLDLVFDN